MPGSMSRLALPLLLLALFAAACGGGDDDGGGGGAEQGASSEACPSGSVEIKMVDIKFDPPEATAGVGQEVCWLNEDTIDHNAVAESGASLRSWAYMLSGSEPNSDPYSGTLPCAGQPAGAPDGSKGCCMLAPSRVRTRGASRA